MQALGKLIAPAVLVSSIGASGQQSANWKEYVFPKDGFALTSPSAPNPHPDMQLLDATAYTMGFPRTNEAITLRVLHQPHDCSTYLNELKTGVQAGKQPGADASSLKDISISGFPGVQYDWSVNPARVMQERYYCVRNQFYSFAIARPAREPLSQEAKRVLSSFRLISQQPHQK